MNIIYPKIVYLQEGIKDSLIERECFKALR